MSRLELVLSIIRNYSTSTQKDRANHYERDALISELYIYVEGLILSNPFIENVEIKKLGMSFCRNWVQKQYYDKPIREYEPRAERELQTRFHSSSKCLSVWCENRVKREGKKWLSRLMAYLYYVESIPYEEIAEIFDKTINAVISTIYNVHIPRKTNMLKKNDVVVLVMDNPFFHQMLGWVKEPTEWGAVVEVESHNYPNRQRWELRATHEEMVYIGTLANIPKVPKKESVDGSKHIVSNAVAMLKPENVYTRDPQFTGDECSQCGKMMMVRVGTCLRCQSCGETTGC